MGIPNRERGPGTPVEQAFSALLETPTELLIKCHFWIDGREKDRCQNENLVMNLNIIWMEPGGTKVVFFEPFSLHLHEKGVLSYSVKGKKCLSQHNKHCIMIWGVRRLDHLFCWIQNEQIIAWIPPFQDNLILLCLSVQKLIRAYVYCFYVLPTLNKACICLRL